MDLLVDSTLFLPKSGTSRIVTNVINKSTKTLVQSKCMVIILPSFLLKQGKFPSTCLMSPFGSEGPLGETEVAQAVFTGDTLGLGWAETDPAGHFLLIEPRCGSS